MGSDFEITINSNGKPSILFIDKGGKKINVGSKLSDFQIEKKLGEGNFGSVYLVTSKITKKLYAMKEIKPKRYKSERDRLEVEKEIKLLENLYHPHVITYFTSFRENNTIYIIIEYINGGSIENLIKKHLDKGKLIDEKLIWDLLVQSLSGLLYLHESKQIIHRDIKPDNLLLDFDGNLKISDFGVSAIKNEEVNDLVKCHYTVAGPISFMAPELALGKEYDFKVDIYMLGLTFFLMMSNQLPEKKIDLGLCILPIKNKNAKLPESYSESLRKFIEKLICIDPEQRYSTKEAYYKAISFYSLKYLQVTSVISSIQCLLSIPSFVEYFNTKRISTQIKNDLNNEGTKYLITNCFTSIVHNIKLNNYNYLIAKKESLKLRILMYANKDRIASSPEIEPGMFISDLINKIHQEINKSKETVIKENIDESNENAVVNAILNKFKTTCHSKISDIFFYITKIISQCSQCKTNIKYFCSIMFMCTLFPYKTTVYLERKDINIIDLFKHYRKKRLFIDQNIYCKRCGKYMKEVNKIKSFYSSPVNLILDIDSSRENDYNLIINENINIQEFVELKSLNNFNYYLVGAIFLEFNLNKDKIYISYSKNENGQWIYFNGKSIHPASFNDLKQHKKLKLLFYALS